MIPKQVDYFISLLDRCNIPYHTRESTNIPKSWQHMRLSSNDIGEGDFFLGLRGSVHNGGEFLPDALSNGAKLALVDESFISVFDAQALTLGDLGEREYLVIFVKDALSAIMKMARALREDLRPQCKFIAVTGSAGKTTTKFFIWQFLNAQQGAISSEGNLNTVQGMVLCLFNSKWDGVKFAVFECGISEAGEMKELVEILSPDYAVVTNVGTAHLGGYRDIEQLRTEKLTVASNISKNAVLWLPEWDDTLNLEAEKMGLQCEIRTFGSNAFDDFIRWEDEGAEGLSLYLGRGGIETPITGMANKANLEAALLVAMYIGVTFSECQVTAKELQLVGGRYEICHRMPLLINDAYNASPEAMYQSAQWFSTLENNPKILVLGGMKELGNSSLALHENLLSKLSDLDFELLILYGDEFSSIKKLQNNVIIEEDTRGIVADLEETISADKLRDAAVLFKGSRFYGLEQVISQYVEALGGQISSSLGDVDD